MPYNLVSATVLDRITGVLYVCLDIEHLPTDNDPDPWLGPTQ
jgi:hypothetical protein